MLFNIAAFMREVECIEFDLRLADARKFFAALDAVAIHASGDQVLFGPTATTRSWMEMVNYQISPCLVSVADIPTVNTSEAISGENAGISFYLCLACHIRYLMTTKAE